MATGLRIIPFFLLAVGMFYYPQEVVSSASSGLAIWWKFVLPALLPFFILSELLMGAGFVHFLGVLLEPLMRPLFRLPGKASFVLAMGYTSGIPVGAILTAKLRQQGDLSREEGERLLAFTSNPSPGFMFGAVASGMLGNPGLGIVLASSVYLGNLAVGLLFRFYRYRKVDHRHSPPASLQRAWQEMQRAQKQDGRPLGQILGDAVKQSVNTVLTVGGFITFFSVIIHMLTVLGIAEFIASFFRTVTLGIIPVHGVEAVIDGLLETTIGCQAAIKAFSDLNLQIALLAFIMGWGGLSVFAQVASFTVMTDLRFSAFVIGRGLQAIFAMGISQVILSMTGIPVGKIPVLRADTSSLFFNTWRLSALCFINTLILLLVLSVLHKFMSSNKTY